MSALAVTSIAIVACGTNQQHSGTTGTGHGGTGTVGSAQSTTGTTTTGSGTGGGAATSSGTGAVTTACIQNDCHTDAECGACMNGATVCDTTSNRCVACGIEGKTCSSPLTCSSYDKCAPAGASCPTDGQGNPMVTCTSDAGCAACDPKHQACDMGTGKCVGCTSSNSTACQTTDHCANDACTSNCPATCSKDSDCASCGASGDAAHACNKGVCSQCSPTQACPSSQTCTSSGVCVAQCGQDGMGACSADAECSQCASVATHCHLPVAGPGNCGPQAAGCSDLTSNVLPAPWDKVTNACAKDSDCAGVSSTIDVGAMLRGLTGISTIKDANLSYPMSVCAPVSVGTGAQAASCGICVPCRADSDCSPINVDTFAGQAFGPIGSVGAAVMLDKLFGPNDHAVHMYCQHVVSSYGVCTACPGLVNICGAN